MIKKQIRTEDQLRKLIPKHSALLDKRVLSSLDGHCVEFLSHTAYFVMGYYLPADDKFGFVVSDPGNRIVDFSDSWLDLALDSDELKKQSGLAASIYCLIPGVGHGMRVNGVLNKGRLNVESAYLHCSRAVVRSELWKDSTNSESAGARFGFLLTVNAAGKTEISPRGDAMPLLSECDQGSFLMAERPGNKVAVSLRNMLATHKAAMLTIDQINQSLCCYQGPAKILADTDLLEPLAINNKLPKVGVLFDHPHISPYPWPVDAFVTKGMEVPAITSFAQALSDHMNGRGLLSKMATPVVSAVISYDLKHLY